ncbi:HWE histidine kinase domain-containing protein [Variovorax sp. RTB1]|uniref:HWE histidine kinase domain-containing protein n=2 Tax=unclassified Variovorax TaxID=663243 RepID=UPI002B226156|nr:HWE histidine kinase domain-containing protein [Variovorax sp. RTB1]MEB0113688.1 HWE histidine kinase domain-containing protein [Variovorax sp. RTB1]
MPIATSANTGATTITASDINNCDREPIHIPGAILPHGVLLVLDRDTLEVLQAAGDLPGLLGKSLHDLLGKSADTVLNPAQTARLRRLSAEQALTTPRHLLDPAMRVHADMPLDASLHRRGDTLVLEFEAANIGDPFASDPLAAVQDMVQGFDAAPSLRALCQLAAERVREVAVYDRVLVYQFMQDGSGWVIAESREPHLEPFLDLHYPAADIPQQARALYLKNWLRLITQVNYDPAPLTPSLNPRTGLPLDMSQAILRDVSPIHREYLRNMGIDASMSISIIHGDKLWGLIACHHYSPRRLPRHLRAVCELFGSMFSLQLEVREKAHQFELRLASRTVLQSLMLNLAGADDYADGLTQQSPNLLDYIYSGSGMDSGKKGGVAVCVKGQLTYLGSTPGEAQIRQLVSWLDGYMPQTTGIYATDRLGDVWAPAKEFAASAAGLLVISVSDNLSDYIIWFRPEIVARFKWAGPPGKELVPGPHGDRLTPRKSFEVWRETIVGRSMPWTSADNQAAFDLRLSLLHVVLRRINAAALERKKAADRDRLLMAELDHRVKNTLANIQALVVQTSRSAETLTGFVQGLDGRIQSMAKAHSLLSEARWEGVSITRLLREELEPFGQRQNVVTIEGNDLVLTPKSALSLSLAIHELVTNAAKFGAFSTPGGTVAVRWTLADDNGISLSWTEAGGPRVRPPSRRGFGSTLIERALAMETGGSATLRYEPAGIVCDVFLPPSSVLSRDIITSASTLAVQPAPHAGSGERPYRILVVEDSFLVVTLLEEIFEGLGWLFVGPATRVVDALDLARTGDFDAALLDVNLNGEMSWEVARVLAERGVPFVFSTGYNMKTVLPADLSGTAVISKPFRISDVADKIRETIAIRRAGK